MSNRSGRRAGITLIEVTVIVAVAGLLMTAGLFWFQTSRDLARRSQCAMNLKQIGLALAGYQGNHGTFPMGWVGAAEGAEPTTATGWGWGTAILPYMEQMSLYNAVNFHQPVANPSSLTARSVSVHVYLCPSGAADPVAVRAPGGAGAAGRVIIADLSRSGYIASAGLTKRRAEADPGGVFFRSSSTTPGAITDGMATTLLIGERAPALADAAWAGVVAGSEVCTAGSGSARDCAPADALVLGFTGSAGLGGPGATADTFAGSHGGDGFFVLGDASVRIIRGAIAPRVLAALATRAGGEPVKPDEF